MQAKRRARKRPAGKPRKKPIPESQRKFGQRVRQLREKRGWSQEGFAHEGGLGRSFSGAIERGEKDVRLSTLIKIAKALAMSVAELLRGVDS
jgi:transcriptional regulator with XRE-family HTH domain